MFYLPQKLKCKPFVYSCPRQNVTPQQLKLSSCLQLGDEMGPFGTRRSGSVFAHKYLSYRVPALKHNPPMLLWVWHGPGIGDQS